jgi:hypothetical protein
MRSAVYLFFAAMLSATTTHAGIILGPDDPAPETGDYIRLMPGQIENMFFDPVLLYNDTFLNELFNAHISLALTPPMGQEFPASTSTLRMESQRTASRVGSRRMESRGIGKRYNDFVCNVNGPWATQAGVGRCTGQLLGLGNTTCTTTPGDPAVLCDVREQGVRTVVRGLSLNGQNQQSRCIDAANGVGWVARNCATEKMCIKNQAGNETVCYMGGMGATTGNGNFIMYVYGDSP